MNTIYLRIDPEMARLALDGQAPAALAELDRQLLPAAQALRAGELVAFPTETVYGLGANALDAAAVARIFAAKGRPADNPLIVHIARPEDLAILASDLPPLARPLLAAFAPGPLTLILPRSPRVPDIVTAGLSTVAVRIPENPIARRLIELAGVPVAAPSANRSGRPSPTRAWHVAEDFDGIIPYIIDGGSCTFGLESTVLDLTSRLPEILRPGAIPAEQIAAVIRASAGDQMASHLLSDTGTAAPASARPAAPKAPGMKYRHYAPKARLVLCDQMTCAERAACLAGQLAAAGCFRAQENARPALVGLYLCGETLNALRTRLGLTEKDLPDDAPWVTVYAKDPDPVAASHHLFNALRSFDRQGITLILAEGLPARGAGVAYMNRLRKAAGGGEEPAGDQTTLNGGQP
jgi:L-threonylcarbamoyladenylate synthase